MDNKYITYNPEELASDETFIKWVQKSENDDSWAKWIEQHPESVDNIEKARKLVESIRFNSFKLSNDAKEKMWNHIDTNTEVSKTQNVRQIIAWVSSAAAILIMTWMVLKPAGLEEIYIEPKDTYVMSLPDASSININADSKVSFDKEKFVHERVINLTGEAFFQVEKGNKFLVDLNGSSVEVLGTSFNIFNRNDSVSVHCYTGKVSVKHKKNSVILTPGEMVSFSKSAPNIQDVKFEMEGEEPKWLNGVYTYTNQSLTTILQEIERQYDVTINYDKNQLSHIRFNGSFENRMALKTALENILWPFNLEFTIENKVVHIH